MLIILILFYVVVEKGLLYSEGPISNIWVVEEEFFVEFWYIASSVAVSISFDPNVIADPV